MRSVIFRSVFEAASQLSSSFQHAGASIVLLNSAAYALEDTCSPCSDIVPLRVSCRIRALSPTALPAL